MQKNITQICKKYKKLVSTGTVVTKKLGMFWGWAQHVSNNYIFTDKYSNNYQTLHVHKKLRIKTNLTSVSLVSLLEMQTELTGDMAVSMQSPLIPKFNALNETKYFFETVMYLGKLSLSKSTVTKLLALLFSAGQQCQRRYFIHFVLKIDEMDLKPLKNH